MNIPEGMTVFDDLEARPLVSHPNGKGARGVMLAADQIECLVYWGTSDWGSHTSVHIRGDLKIVGQEHPATVAARRKAFADSSAPQSDAYGGA